MLNQEFRSRRVRLGKTQQQLAVETRLSRKTISDFERGVGAITLGNLNRLLLAVGLELTTREASRVPSFDELADVYAEAPEERMPAGRARPKR